MAINFNQPYIHTIQLGAHKIDVLRLDAIHQFVSGNKWYKLKGHLDYIKSNNLDGFVTFGGAYSNHLHAAAYAGHHLGLKMVAIIRGEENQHQLSPTLQACSDLGMKLVFVARAEYKKRTDQDYQQLVQAQYPHLWLIPEGGSGALGEMGFETLRSFIDPSYQHICLSVGSGTSLKGIGRITHDHQHVWGFVPMKNGIYLAEELSLPAEKYTCIDTFHFGGFGKYTEELIRYMNTLYSNTQLPTDIVYTSKMFYGLQQLLADGHFESTYKILAIHTGGLQGNNSIIDKIIFQKY